MNKNPSIADIKNDAAGRWLEIFSALAPSLDEAIKKMPRHVPCPVNGGKDGFRFFIDASATGGAISNSHGYLGGIDLIMFVLDEDFPTVLSMVKDYLYGEQCDAKYSKTLAKDKALSLVKPIDYSYRKEICRNLWVNSYPLLDAKSKIARKYLLSRGINVSEFNLDNLKHVLRFNPKAPYYFQGNFLGNFPAIIAGVSYPDGSYGSIHRTYLDSDGRKLSLVVGDEKVAAKKLTSTVTEKRISGGAIRFGKPQNGEINIAEGIETAFSVMLAIKKPVWSCVSATLLSNFKPPMGVSKVRVWADKDRNLAGEKAANELKGKVDRGIEVIIHLPQGDIKPGQKSIDWNDILNIYGCTVIRDELLKKN